MFDVETKLGNIYFSQNVINRIVIEAVGSCNGKAEILNYKGRYITAVPILASKINLYDEESGGIQIIGDKDGVQIKVYLVIRFGESIKNITDKIIDRIYEDVERIFGEKPKEVRAIITGVLSKNIVKRHIEVIR